MAGCHEGHLLPSEKSDQLQVWQHKERGELLINAAMVYRNTTKTGNPPEVINL